jgi:hypothetical protein
VYTTATASKADDYAKMATVGHHNTFGASGRDNNIVDHTMIKANNAMIKAVLVVKVVAGKVKRLLEPADDLMEPPPGHDSVVGLSPAVFEDEEGEHIDPMSGEHSTPAKRIELCTVANGAPMVPHISRVDVTARGCTSRSESCAQLRRACGLRRAAGVACGADFVHELYDGPPVLAARESYDGIVWQAGRVRLPV